MQTLLLTVEKGQEVADKKGKHRKYFGQISPGGVAQAEAFAIHVANLDAEDTLPNSGLFGRAFRDDVVDNFCNRDSQK